MAAGNRVPDPKSEIRMTTLHATRGANYWSRFPITRMDLEIGAYEEISSADVPGFTESLIAVMPGLRDHRCSIGEHRDQSIRATLHLIPFRHVGEI